MRILVLDSIHGGDLIAGGLRENGHACTAVDVYRGDASVVREIQAGDFDLLVAPVHLDPDYPLLHFPLPAITHHEAVRWLLSGKDLPRPFIEVTGKQGKTTTAHAIAHTLEGPGILHTSSGTSRYPEREQLYRASITPASLLRAVREAERIKGWLVAEVSLGVTGAGDLAVLTSDLDYGIAAGKRSAIVAKMASLVQARRVIAPASLPCTGVHPSEMAAVDGDECRYRSGQVTGSFTNPLLKTGPYRAALPIAATVALLTGGDPSRLAEFTAVPGRMEVSRDGGWSIVNDSNSGMNQETCRAAAEYAREDDLPGPLVLVIGEEFRAVCEGFSAPEAATTILSLKPDAVVSVGSDEYGASVRDLLQAAGFDKSLSHRRTLPDGLSAAKALGSGGTIIATVKTWR